MSDPTPGPYGFNATRETREAVEAEIARQKAQRARRKTEHARPEGPAAR